MKTFIGNPYFIGYSLLYIIVLIFMVNTENFPISQALAVLVIIGGLFSFIAYITSKSANILSLNRPVQKRENLLLLSLLIYITLFLSFGIDFIKSSFPQLTHDNTITKEIFTICYKLIFFVIVPFLFYKFIFKFNIRDFGLSLKPKELFTRRNAVILLSMALTLLVFQFFIGNGAKSIREGMMTSRQLMIGLPLLYIWLIFEVGLVEEFFFRALVQSRLAAITKSETGGILLSGLFFGLAHAPGFYLRGSGTLDSLGTNPSLLMSIGYGIIVLSVAGFFLSIIWSKTRNLWLVMAIHAFVDLLPNVHEFVNTWGIH